MSSEKWGESCDKTPHCIALHSRSVTVHRNNAKYSARMPEFGWNLAGIWQGLTSIQLSGGARGAVMLFFCFTAFQNQGYSHWSACYDSSFFTNYIPSEIVWKKTNSRNYVQKNEVGSVKYVSVRLTVILMLNKFTHPVVHPFITQLKMRHFKY